MRKKEWTLVTGVVDGHGDMTLPTSPVRGNPETPATWSKHFQLHSLGSQQKKNPSNGMHLNLQKPISSEKNIGKSEKLREVSEVVFFFVPKNPDTSPGRIGFFGVPIPSPGHRIIGEIPSLGHTNGSLGQPATRLRSALLLPHLLSFFGSFQIGSLGVESGCG